MGGLQMVREAVEIDQGLKLYKSRPRSSAAGKTEISMFEYEKIGDAPGLRFA